MKNTKFLKKSSVDFASTRPGTSRSGGQGPGVSTSVPTIPATKSAKSSRSRRTLEEDYVERYIVIPPDGGWSWVVVLGAFITYFIADGILFSFGIFLNAISAHFGCTKSEVSLAGAIKSGVFSLSGPLSAALINKYGYRKISVLGSLLAMIASVLASQAPNLPTLIAFHGIIGGFGFGMIYVTAVTVIGFYFEKWRALANGIAVCGAGCGGIAMPPILTILLDTVGWRYTFIALACMSVLCLLSGLLFKNLTPVRVFFLDSTHTALVVDPTTSVVAASKYSFFDRYHNANYPTIIEPSQGYRLAKATSTEVMLTNYISASNESNRMQPSTVSAPAIMAPSAPPVDMVPAKRIKWLFRCCQRRPKTVSKDCAPKPVKLGNGDTKESHVGWCKSLRQCSLSCKCCYDDEGQEEFAESNARPEGLPPHAASQRTIRINMRPMYRDDIFYTGSMAILPEYRTSRASTFTKVTDMRSNLYLDYHMSITRVTTHREVRQNRATCPICPESIKRIIATMLDFRLLRSKQFLLLGLNAVFCSIGFYTPYMFIKDRGLQHGITEDYSFWFISTIGLTNTFGRITCGVMSTFPTVRADVLSCIFLIIGGIATMMSSLSYDVNYQFGYCAIYGLSMCAYANYKRYMYWVVQMTHL